MSYAELHAFSQTLPVRIGRNVIRQTVLDLTGLTGGRQVRTALDTTVCRGLYLSARNTEEPFVRQLGGCVIAVARGLDEAMDRFIYIKELMHMFDDPDRAVDTADKFEALLDEFTVIGAPAWSAHMLSEFGCFWMALGAICPEEVRKQLEADRDVGKIDDDGIAAELGIPTQYVPRLFEPRYPQLIARLVAGEDLG